VYRRPDAAKGASFSGYFRLHLRVVRIVADPILPRIAVSLDSTRCIIENARHKCSTPSSFCTCKGEVTFRFVFTGDPGEAERSPVLDKLREDLENKKYLVEQFFRDRQIGFVVEFRCSVTPTNRTMAPGRVPSSLQTNLSLLAAEAKRERVLHTTPKEKKAAAHEERIHNSHLGLLRSELCTLDTAQFTRFVARPTSLCHHLFESRSPVSALIRT
jgi:hypothetical protein